ncbi:DNA-methyltransferase [Cytobacillus horneckiae]|uniref:DNA-methyltransferase n=1 Tax=Cytobacillus horneckiae TaxID=549687 RepID=UPI0019D2E7C6|nr:site-specific DNA-methyltransferase [Cytobacillus horneckiae]MBN6886224.1 site-specific DNA-methyltransferase [Cytobacillus horneckiae]
MKNIPDKSIDMILCDLPFGTTKCKWDTVIPVSPLWEQYERIIKDNGAILLFAQTPFDKFLGSSNLKMLRYEWIWEKTAATGHLNAKKMPMKAHENILVFYKKLPVYHPQKTQGHKQTNSFTKYLSTQNRTEIYGKATAEIKGGGEADRYPRSVINFPSDKQHCNLHPTQKPVALCEYLIKTYSNEGDLILDNCMGSGTTAIAALNTNRKFLGYELDEYYFKISEERIKAHNKQLNLALQL